MTADLLISAPYPERAVRALIEYLPESGNFEQVTVALAQPLDKASVVASPRWSRKVVGPTFALFQWHTTPNIARAALALLSRWPRMQTRFMYMHARNWDHLVCKRVANRLKRSTIIIGMPGGCAQTFRSAPPGSLKVLHMVNGHPRFHNTVLRTEACIPSAHHEMVPEYQCARIETEIDLADLILLPSELVRDQFVNQGVSVQKLTVIPYGTDLARFAPLHNVAKAGVMFVGQISHRKGLKILRAVAEKLPDISFTLFGPIVSPEVLSELPANMVFLGKASRDEVANAMARCACFLLPSLEDACSLVTMEALASGAPVVTTSRNGSGIYIRQDVNGFVVPPNDINATVHAVSACIGRQLRGNVTDVPSWRDYAFSVLRALVQT